MLNYLNDYRPLRKDVEKVSKKLEKMTFLASLFN